MNYVSEQVCNYSDYGLLLAIKQVNKLLKCFYQDWAKAYKTTRMDKIVRSEKMEKIIFVGIGGFIGASLRYIISINPPIKLFGVQLPYGTLLVNVIGGLLVGVIMELSISTDWVSPNLKLFLTTGMMGGLTTFSTFSYETIILFNESRYLLGALNICLNLFLSLGAVLVGKSVVSNIL